MRRRDRRIEFVVVFFIAIDDVDRDATLGSGTYDRAQGLGDTTAAADDFAEVVGIDLEFEHGSALIGM